MDQTSGQDALFSDSVLFDGTPTTLTFHADGILRWSEDGRANSLVLEREVLGVSVQGSRIVLKCAVVSGSRFFCFNNCGPPALMRKSFLVEPSSENSLRELHQKLSDYLTSLSDRPKRLFIFVNPFGGKKSASMVFADNVKPLLDDAEIQFTMMETKHQLHAKEVAHELDLTMYDGIVCVSGDGILVEVINGLLQREDWRTAIKMPIGIVPGGTGNGMVKSLLDSVGEPCSVINAVLVIIRGHKQSLDVTTVLQGDTRFFSVLMLAWGLVADIDIESEKYRFMGSARIDFYAILRIFRLRKYLGRIHFVPATGYESQVEHISQKVEAADALQFRNPSELTQKSQKFAYLGAEISPDDLEWRTIEGPFISVWLHNVPWGSEDAMPAPNAKFSDGYLDLVLIRDCPKMVLASVMTEVSKGNHIKSPHVLYIKVKAFILEPGQRTEDSTKGGIIDSDGEVLARGSGTYMCEKESVMAYDKLQMTVDQGLAILFAPWTGCKMSINKPLKKLSSVVFDLDGTLLNTDGVVQDILKVFLSKYGKQWDGREAGKIVGKTPWEAASAVVADYNLSCTADELLSEMNPAFNNQCCNIRALPGANRLIKHLRSHSIPLALASNSSKHDVDLKISFHQGWKQSFSVIVGGDEVANGKPSPEIFLEAAKRLNVEPHVCLAIEDSFSGVTAGKAAGMVVVVVPSFPKQSHLYGSADEVINSLYDMRPELWGLPPFEDWVDGTLPLEPWRMGGPVIKGYGRGSKVLGIPTANLSTEGYSELLSEHPSGVFFGWAGLSTRGVYKMVMSIGWNPFFNNSEKTIEPWLLHDFGEDFYGEELRLIVVGYIRPEANFPSLDSLIEKIHEDGDIARRALDLPVYAKHKNDPYLTSPLMTKSAHC